MFPAISIVGGLYNVWIHIGLYDTWLGLIPPYLSFSLPLSIYILSAFFREIPGTWRRPRRWMAPRPCRRSGR
jgi:multiple sugar transport system permease protein